ncbi:LysR family transcriptional regulator [Anaerotignum sp.]
MELRNLITFLKVVETGSFSKAAESLRYSQSTVTVQIQQLEEELHVRLFDRCSKKAVLTEKGHTLEEYAKEMIALSQKASCIGHNQDTFSGTLCIASMDCISSTILPKIIALFHKKYPDVNIVVKNIFSPASAENELLSNDADIALIFDRQTDSNRRFQRTILQKDALVFVASPAYLATKKENTLAGAPDKTSYILSSYLQDYDSLIKDDALKGKTISVDNPMAAMELAMNGCGITLLPHFFVKKALNCNYLQVLDNTENEIPMWIQVIQLKEKFVTPQTEVFYKLINQYFCQ